MYCCRCSLWGCCYGTLAYCNSCGIAVVPFVSSCGDVMSLLYSKNPFLKIRMFSVARQQVFSLGLPCLRDVLGTFVAVTAAVISLPQQQKVMRMLSFLSWHHVLNPHHKVIIRTVKVPQLRRYHLNVMKDAYGGSEMSREICAKHDANGCSCNFYTVDSDGGSCQGCWSGYVNACSHET